MNNQSKRKTDGTSKNNWRTPPWLWERLQAEFQFEVDGASDGTDNLLPDFHTYKYSESVKIMAYENKKVFINPPFNQLNIEWRWLHRLHYETEKYQSIKFTCFLIPFAPETRHWHAWVWPYATIFVFNKNKIKMGIATPLCLTIYSREPVDTNLLGDLGVWVKKI